MKPNSRSFKALFVSIIIGVTAACTTTTVPLTGRKQLSSVPGAPSNEQIMQLSAESYVQLMDSLNLSSDQAQVQMIKSVGNRIKNAVENYFAEQGNSAYLDGFNWEFNLIDNDSSVNAWAMPGGKVAFYTGILPICQDEQGVAVVMGHEVAHAIARHGLERVNQTYAKQIGLTVGAVALGQDPTSTQRIIFQAVGLGADLTLLKYSRTHESEADELGLLFMAMAGYDPREAPKFWERMSAGSGGQAPPEFMSTHPSHETRIKRLNENLPKALEYYNNNN